MPLFEDIGRTNAVGNFAQNTLQNAIQLKTLKTNEAISADTLQRERERHALEVRKLQAEEQARKQQEKLRATRVPLENHPFFQSLPSETQNMFRGYLNNVDPVDTDTNTYSLGGIQDTIKLMETDSGAFKAVMGPVVAKTQSDMVAAQQVMQKLEQAGKTDSKEYAEAKANFESAQQKYLAANDGLAQHLFTLKEIEARARERRRELDREKDPLKAAKDRISIINTELDSLLKTYRTTPEENAFLAGLRFSDADFDNPNSATEAVSFVNQNKTVYEGLPPQVKERVDDILAEMKAITMGALGKPGVQKGDIQSIRQSLRGE